MTLQTRTSRSPLLIALSLLLPAVFILLCIIVYHIPFTGLNSLLWAVCYPLLALCTTCFLTQNEKRERVLYGLLGFLFATAQAVGYRLQTAGSTGALGLLLCLGIGVSLAPSVGLVFLWLSRTLDRVRPAKERHASKQLLRLAFTIILLGWLPVFLAYYPGLFAYDVGTQIGEVVDGALTNHNPLLHTLFLGGFYLLGGALGSHTLGIALSVVCQMLMLAAIYAHALGYLARQGCNRAAWWGSLLFFALFPVHAMLAISCTKDTLFSGILLLYVIRLHAMSRAPALMNRPRWVIGTLALMALMCLLRNNAYIGILLSVPLGFFWLLKAYKIRFMALMLGAIIASFGISTGVLALFQAGGTNPTELVSLPSQQMSRVYALHQDTLPASVEIAYYLPTVQDYTPHSADAVKTFANVRRPGRLWGFIKLWGKLGLQFPFEYLDAFLLNTQGYWWLWDTTHASIYGQGLETRQGYLLSDTKPGFGVVHTSLLPALETFYEQLFSANAYQRVPLLSLLFAPSLYVWLTLFSFLRALLLRRHALLMVSGFLLFYFLPLLLGPCSLIRYVYPLIACMPLLLFMPASEKQSNAKQLQETQVAASTTDL